MSEIASECPIERGVGMEELTLKEEKFLTALMLTPNMGKACEKVGISRRTAQRYMAKTTVRSAYRKMRNQAMEQATSRLNSVAVEAVEVLTAIMNDPKISPYARQQSARTILEFAYKAYENEAIIEKLEELETVISIDNKDI